MNKINLLAFLFRHTHNSIVKRRCIKQICQLEGGEAYSKTARKLFEEAYGLHIGYGTYGGIWTNGALHWQDITIGNYCSFASHISIYTGNHPTDRFTTHPILYNPSLGARKTEEVGKPLTIGNDVWVGQDAIILPGCHKIGNGAIIGAGAVVTRDVEPYTVYAGNPAKAIKKRFSDNIIQKLEESRWWSMELNELQRNIDSLEKLTQE
jgi:acetyltransferase-like isoleucine patch superfamily enzyme